MRAYFRTLTDVTGVVNWPGYGVVADGCSGKTLPALNTAKVSNGLIEEQFHRYFSPNLPCTILIRAYRDNHSVVDAVLGFNMILFK